MREFVINEIEPIELFFDDMTAGNWRKLTAPLKDEV
jgi:hypothetical protein